MPRRILVGGRGWKWLAGGRVGKAVAEDPGGACAGVVRAVQA